MAPKILETLIFAHMNDDYYIHVLWPRRLKNIHTYDDDAMYA